MFSEGTGTNQESGDQYQQILQLLPVAVYATDINGYITFFNPAAAVLWGRQPELGKDQWCGSWKLFRMDGSPLPPDHHPVAVTLKESRAVAGEHIIIERHDGIRLHVQPHSKPVFNADGKVIGTLNILADATETSRSGQALEESDKKLLLLTNERKKQLNHSSQEMNRVIAQHHKMIEEVEDYAILLMDKNGFIQNWNKGAEKIKGYKESEILGKNFRIFYLPEDQARQLPEVLIQKAMTEGKALHEGWRVRKDGTTFWGSIVITALHDDQGNVIGFSKVTRDLTERKNAEDEVIRYAQMLEAQNKELRYFAYAAAHDMKEPLRKVQFYTSTILESENQRLLEKEKRYLQKAAEAAKRMQKLIEDLLMYTGSSAEGVTFEPVDLNAVLNEVKVLHQETIDETQAVVEVKPLPVIMGIPFQMIQLFDNLLGNALKYHHADRRPLIVISYKKDVAPSLNDDTNTDPPLFYKISVQDNGIGFEPENEEKIFEMFERLHGRDSYPGTGIGLSLCKKIVQNHKGTIWATGKLNEGACFDIYLPIPNGR